MVREHATAVDVRPLERGQRLTLALGPLDAFGECTAQAEGFPVHVFGGIPGEQVVAEVVRCFRDRADARAVEVPVPSPDRVAPPCPYFGPCTGCQWQHIRYDRQLALKRDMVAGAMETAGLPPSLPLWPTLPSPQEFGYRNHARFTVGPAGSVGFVNRTTRGFVKVERCLLMHPAINGVLEKLQDRSAETTQLSVRYGVGSGDVLVQPRLRDARVTVPTGQQAYHEVLLGRRFRVASPSFFQTNTPQTERLVELLRAHLDPGQNELLVDAYAGVGTFSALLAPYVKQVVAIEESASALSDARQNVTDLTNVRFLEGKTELRLAQLAGPPDVVVLDPPRGGCHPDALAALVRLGPPKVLYVSCQPATLARDLTALLAGPYRLSALYPVDMFPHTNQVECVAVLHRLSGASKAQKRITLASASPRRRELLQALGVPFEVAPSAVDEGPAGPGQDVASYVAAVALAKARAVAPRAGECIVLGADTIVVLDGQPLGKPSSHDDARQMLARLRGRAHEVLTGVAVVDAGTGSYRTHVERSGVLMRAYTDEELEAYIATGGPFDKAGAYAVQDTHSHPAQRVDGCYFNVMGLPMCALGRLLAEFGVDTPCTLPRGGDEACALCRLWTPFHQENSR